MTTELQALGAEATPNVAAAPVSSNGGPPDAETSVRDLLKDSLDGSDSADPNATAEALLSELGPDQLRSAALVGLKFMARDLVRKNRKVENRRASSSESSRWDDVAEAEKDHPNVLMERVCIVQGNQHVPAVWKFLGECTSSDLAGAESIKREQAAGHIAAVKAYQRLRGELKSPKQQVKSLGAARVREILYA